MPAPPPVNAAVSPGLGSFIRTNLEPILQEWERFARSLMPLAGMNAEALRDHAHELLICIADDMDSPQSELERRDKSEGGALADSSALDKVGLLHGTARLKDEFTMGQLVAEFRAIRASVLRLWADSQPGVSDAVEEVTRFNEAIDQALAVSAARYATRMDESRTLILGMLAHDLRSPLSGISLGMNYLLLSDKTSPSATKVAARTLRSVDEMSAMIGDLLDFTSVRLGRGIPTSMQAVNVGHLCIRAVDNLEASYPGRLLNLERRGDLMAQCDGGRISQLIVNLLTNALHHGDPDREVTLRAVGSAAEILISVHNHGEPIPEAQRSQLFEPLNRAVAERHGLEGSSGLRLGPYIAAQIASAHRGNLTLVSTAVDGTTFTARLPKGGADR